MGVDKYFDEYVIGLSSSNGAWRVKCIRYLGEIGDKRAVKYLIPILGDDRPAKIVHGRRSGLYSLAAAEALRDILPDVFEQFAQKHSRHGFIF
jgi:HEAT repeat protein